MTKNTFWQKLNYTINQIGLFKNNGILVLNIVETDKVEGTTTHCAIERNITIPAPEKVSSGMIDGARICNGDMQTVIDFISLRKIYEGLSGGIAWNETTGLLQPGIDMLRFAGITYRIKTVIPEDWQDNSPGCYILILDAISKSE